MQRMNWIDLLTYWPFHAFVSLCVFVWGTCIGSFLNVCIHRIPLELSVIKPRSACPGCGFAIPWYLNIPIFSYLSLRGRCHSCKMRISPRYVLVEALTGLLFLLTWLKFSPFGATVLGLTPAENVWLIPIYWLVVAGLILGTFVDFEHLIIPDRVTLGGIAAGLLLSVAVPAMHNETHPMRGLMQSAFGAGLGWCLLWGVAELGELLFKKEAMGFGDVKLLGAVGAFFGLSPADLHSSRRTRTISLARRLTAFFARRHTRMSYPEVGRFLGKNHSSIVLAVQQMEKSLAVPGAT
jgi:leader peptidase (prepilin peptidase)/N-methyltransferase